MNTSPGGNLTSNRVLQVICRQLTGIVLLSALSSFSLSAGTIQFQLTTNGTTGTYVYFLSGFDFRANAPCGSPIHPLATGCSDELDIDFDPSVFSGLSNGVAPADFDLAVFQPNNPPSAPGDYSALALLDHASLAGPFSVAFTLFPGQLPGPQTFSIRQFANNGNGSFEGIVESGTTAPVGSGVPEPASSSLSGTALVLGGVVLACRRAWSNKPAANSLLIL
jgi:hypothetical protein